MRSTLLRNLVAFAAVLIAIAYVAWDFLAVVESLPPPDQNAAHPAPSLASTRACVDLSIGFYGCVYAVGKAAYLLFRRKDLAEALHGWSRWHMYVLNTLGGAWLCYSAWQSFADLGVIRPAAVVGSTLLAISTA